MGGTAQESGKPVNTGQIKIHSQSKKIAYLNLKVSYLCIKTRGAPAPILSALAFFI